MRVSPIGEDAAEDPTVVLICPELNVFAFERKDTLASYLLGHQCSATVYRLQKKFLIHTIVIRFLSFVVCASISLSGIAISGHAAPAVVAIVAGILLSILSVAVFFCIAQRYFNIYSGVSKYTILFFNGLSS